NQPEFLFQDATMTLYEGDHVGLLGRNGAGKTTLLRLLLDELEPTSGSIIRNAPIGIIRQEDQLEDATTTLSALFASHPKLASIHEQMTALEQTGIPNPLTYADLVHDFSTQGGYDLCQQFEQEVSLLGFEEDVLSQPVSSLSGGQRRLLKLMSAFVQPSPLLLLDEPTNYLDERATQYLINKLTDYYGACLIISHDRWFLDQVVTQIYELNHQQVTHYSGNYSQFRATKDATFKQQTRQKERLEADIGKLQETARSYVIWGGRKEKEKSGAMDKGFIGARAARLQKRGLLAKERMLTKIDELETTKPWLDKHYSITFPEGIDVPTGTCLTLQSVSFDAYQDGDNDANINDDDTSNETPNSTSISQPILSDLHLTLPWGSRLALVAANGSGKTTLFKLLTSTLMPTSGQVLWSKGIKLGYLPQVWTVPDDVTTIAELFSHDESHQARIMLGALHVKGDVFFKPLNALSEGQKRKVSLVRLMLDSPNVLLLDEPSTHLDYESLEMLEHALASYPGTILLVSHDKYLRERVCDQHIDLSELSVELES
ncbi:MAG: ABC-F family ATP-binding cassette domain-containing protein, partial [Deinococcota bacterium]